MLVLELVIFGHYLCGEMSCMKILLEFHETLLSYEFGNHDGSFILGWIMSIVICLSCSMFEKMSEMLTRDRSSQMVVGIARHNAIWKRKKIEQTVYYCITALEPWSHQGSKRVLSASKERSLCSRSAWKGEWIHGVPAEWSLGKWFAEVLNEADSWRYPVRYCHSPSPVGFWWRPTPPERRSRCPWSPSAPWWAAASAGEGSCCRRRPPQRWWTAETPRREKHNFTYHTIHNHKLNKGGLLITGSYNKPHVLF